MSSERVRVARVWSSGPSVVRLADGDTVRVDAAWRIHPSDDTSAYIVWTVWGYVVTDADGYPAPMFGTWHVCIRPGDLARRYRAHVASPWAWSPERVAANRYAVRWAS